MTAFTKNVFLNCPFDEDYKPIFDAIYFTVQRCGFSMRSAKEAMDTTTVRMDKILNLISGSKYSIHDLSRVEYTLDHTKLPEYDVPLPRFNMPLELGVTIGCQKFGSKAQRTMKYLVLVREANQYKKFISDLSGQDPQEHQNDQLKAIKAVRNWLTEVSVSRVNPSPSVIRDEFFLFQEALPELCKPFNWKSEELTFQEYGTLMESWFSRGSLA